MTEMTIDATEQNIPAVVKFIDEQLQCHHCPIKEQVQIDVVVSELFGNIAKNLEQPKKGPVNVRVEITEQPFCVVITFIGHGSIYDPIESREYDHSYQIQEQDAGKFGIYIGKKNMDEMQYLRKDGENILIIKKTIS